MLAPIKELGITSFIPRKAVAWLNNPAIAFPSPVALHPPACPLLQHLEPEATVDGVFVTGRQMGLDARQVFAICRVLASPAPVSGLAAHEPQ